MSLAWLHNGHLDPAPLPRCSPLCTRGPLAPAFFNRRPRPAPPLFPRCCRGDSSWRRRLRAGGNLPATTLDPVALVLNQTDSDLPTKARLRVWR